MYKQTNLHDALPKFLNGDELSDTELADIIRFYGEAILVLNILADTNPAYEFGRQDVQKNLVDVLQLFNYTKKQNS